MTDTNLPEGTGDSEALTVDTGADAISGLLKDPETDLSEEDQGQEEQEATEETEAEGEQSETEETEEATEEKPEPEQDGPGYESGKFASDTANVRLKDGTVISVQDLKRGFLSQQSFTRGTQENAREKETLASQRAEIEQHARTLQAEREFVLQLSHQFLPPAPDESLLDQSSASYDPLRYIALKADYDKRVGLLSQLQSKTKGEQARMEQEQQRELNNVRDREAKLLVEAMPELKNRDVYNKFWAESVDTMSEYGFSAEEMNSSPDHRLYRVYRDLAAYRRARQNLPTVKKAVQSKPVLTGKKRMDPKEKGSRELQARKEQLRQTGSFDDGVNALMDLDL